MSDDPIEPDDATVVAISDATIVAISDATIVAMARTLIALDLPADCIAGVRSNLAALADHVARMEGRA